MKATGASVDVSSSGAAVLGDVSRDALSPLTRAPDGYSVRVERFTEDGGRIEMYGVVHTTSGAFAGEFGSTFHREGGQLIAKTDNVLMESMHQGKGAGAAIVRNMDETYRRLGVSEVRLDAAQVGRYVWAKAGYNYDASTGRQMEASFSSWLAKHGHDASEASVALRGARALAESPHGKAFLLSDAPNWRGTKRLK